MEKLSFKNLIVIFVLIVACRPEQDESEISSAIERSDTTNAEAKYTDPLKLSENSDYTGNKRPFLIYYAVDGYDRRSEGLEYSTEPPGTELFMQDSVDYEVGKLREVCQGNRFVNFIIIRNSDVVRNQTYEICNQGVLKTKSLRHLYDFQLNLMQKLFGENSNNKIDKCADGNIGSYIKENIGSNLMRCSGTVLYPHTEKFRFNEIDHAISEKSIPLDQKNMNPYVLQSMNNFMSTIDYAKFYGEMYPLINPYFLLGVVSNRIIHPFHHEQFIPVWYFKSHGHFDYALTGLMPHQIFKKDLKQSKLVDDAREKGTLDPRVSLRSPISKFEFSDSGTLSQDDVCGLETKGALYTLGVEGSNSSGTDNVNTLGAGSIFIGNQPGITPETLLEIITYSKNNDNDWFNDKELASYETLYTVIGACDATIANQKNSSNKERWQLNNSHLMSKLRYLYAPIGSLNYRHIDWHEVFLALGKVRDYSSHAQQMQKILNLYLPGIPNSVMEKGGEDKLLIDYNNVVDSLRTKVEAQR